MAILADFSTAASQGFEQGQKMAGTNPLGNFIKMMLAHREEVGKEQRDYAMKTNLQEREFSMQSALKKQELAGQKELFGQKSNLLTDLAKIKANSTVPKQISDTQKYRLQLWKQAEQEAFKEAGGSLMVGIGSKKIEYKKRKEEIFKELLRREGISDVSIPQETQSIEDIIPQQSTDLMDYEW